MVFCGGGGEGGGVVDSCIDCLKSLFTLGLYAISVVITIILLWLAEKIPIHYRGGAPVKKPLIAAGGANVQELSIGPDPLPGAGVEEDDGGSQQGRESRNSGSQLKTQAKASAFLPGKYTVKSVISGHPGDQKLVAV
jgi:hypothetical protein